MEPEEELLALLDPQSGEAVLEVGCGLGKLTKALVERGCLVTAIDPDEASLEQARLIAPLANFVCAGLLEYENQQAFDAIVSRGALHWIRPSAQVPAHLYGLLKASGRLAAEWGGCVREFTDDAWLPSPGEVACALEAVGFQVRLVVCYDEDRGRAPRVRVLAVKAESENH